MPEMFYPTEALASSKDLHATTALVTDGRFSGASRGPCVGYVSPEAASGGPIAVLRDGDLVEIDIPGRSLNVVGIEGKRQDRDEVDAAISERLARWKRPEQKYTGVLGLYTSLATSAMDGGYIDYDRR
jgi:dihydroxy-acid dehydratase